MYYSYGSNFGYNYGGFGPGYGCCGVNPCCGGGYGGAGYGYGAAIILVLFILLVIVIGYGVNR